MERPSWQQITDQRITKRQRPRPHICARENKMIGTRSGYGYHTLETLESHGETLLEHANTGKYMGNIPSTTRQFSCRTSWLGLG